jgi:hypothetical protein
MTNKGHSGDCGAERAVSLDQAIHQLKGQSSPSVRGTSPTVRFLAEDERSLEARLKRALTPAMRKRLAAALR